MNEPRGVTAALLASVLGGTAAVATRYIIGTIDPLSIAMLRYTIGALLLFPFAVRAVPKFTDIREPLAMVSLGVLFFALYPYLFALSLAHTTAARGALALATMPLLTLGLAILLGREAFSWRRLIGILISVAGLAYAFSPKLGQAISTVWKGDLIMFIAAVTQSVYNVFSRPFIQRVGALAYTAFGMCIGALVLVAFSAYSGVVEVLPPVGVTTWAAIFYLGVFGGALLWVLWSIGIRHARASSVALTVTVNPLTASLLGAVFLSEPIGHEFVVGLLFVVFGIATATTNISSSSTRNETCENER